MKVSPGLRGLQRLQDDTLDEAAADRRIRGAPFLVYFYLSSRLEPWTFREVLVKDVAAKLDLGFPTVAQALPRLVNAGYLEVQDARPKLYRLALRELKRAG